MSLLEIIAVAVPMIGTGAFLAFVRGMRYIASVSFSRRWRSL